MKTLHAGSWVAVLAALWLAGCGGGSGGGPDVSGDVPGDVPSDGIGDPGSGDDPGERPDGLIDPGTDSLADVPDPADVGVDVPACGDDAAVAVGVDWLEKAEPLLALRAFEDALATCPDDPRARFGAGLASLILAGEQFVTLLTVATGQMTGPSLPDNAASIGVWPAGGATQSEILAEKLHRTFAALQDLFEDALEHLEAMGDAEPGVAFDTVPVYLGIKPTFLLTGRFDSGDVLWMRVIASFASGIIGALAAQDLNTDILSMVGWIKDHRTGKVDFSMISQIAAYLLNDDARFLTLHAGDGEELLASARLRLADCGRLLPLALDRIEALGDDGTDTTWVEETSLGRVLGIRSLVTVGEGGAIQETPWALALSEATLAGFAQASNSILTPGAKVTLHGGVLPVLATIAVVMVRSGLLDTFGISLPDFLDLTVLEVDDVVAVLQGLLPNVMAFDWGGAFERSAGMRVWLPAVTTDGLLMDNRMIVEWECPDDTAATGYPTGTFGLLCKSGAALADAAHFQDTSFAIAADGKASGVPVLAFHDYTLNGLVFVDLAGVSGSDDASTYVPADGTSLNAAIAALLGPILLLLN